MNETIQGVKVFSSTKARERELMGEMITDWMRSNQDKIIVDKIITQSSDNEFHCLTITLFYKFVERKLCGSTWGVYRCALDDDGHTECASTRPESTAVKRWVWPKGEIPESLPEKKRLIFMEDIKGKRR